MKILVTGVAGFIGFHLTKKLLESQSDIVGIDNLNDYYDEQLKLSRLSLLRKEGLKFFKIDITHKDIIKNFFHKFLFS